MMKFKDNIYWLAFTLFCCLPNMTIGQQGPITIQKQGVFAVGGTWVAKKEWVTSENWEAITAACVDALEA